MVEHTVRVMPKKRQAEDLIEKRKKIGELLKLEKVPLHVLAWQEPRLELGDGDCYPVVDILEKIAELMGTKQWDPADLLIDKPMFETCACGFEAKTRAGLKSHMRGCPEAVAPPVETDA